mgnify:CR=1 FL=1
MDILTNNTPKMIESKFTGDAMSVSSLIPTNVFKKIIYSGFVKLISNLENLYQDMISRTNKKIQCQLLMP